MSSGIQESWFEDEILDGLAMLFVLGLPNTPAAEAITTTARAWCLALWNMPIGWVEDADTWRIKKAFIQLMGRADRFPTPNNFYVLLESIKRKDLVQIGTVVDISDEERAANAERFSMLLKSAMK